MPPAAPPDMSGIRYLGHAGFLVEHAGTRILMDPWFHAAFLRSWFPLPDNRAQMAEVAGQRFDWLYVSHTHEDHLDERLLATLDRTTRVLVPRYRSGALERRLRALGFADLVLLGHRESRELAPGLVATMLLDTSHKEDSALLLDMGGFRFLDLNDCNTPMSELPHRVDLLAAQFSGAMWYPNCYDFPPDTMAEKVASVRRDLMDTLHRKVALTGARAYLPSAGPACFLDPQLAEFNDPGRTIFPRWEHVSEEFGRACPGVQVLRARPGDAVRFAPWPGGQVALHRAPGAPSTREEDLTAYRERRRDEWTPYHNGPEPAIAPGEVEAYFAGLVKRNRALMRDFRKDIALASGGREWRIRLGRLAEQFEIESEEPLDPAYTFAVPPRVLRAVLDGVVGWEEALLSMRVRLRRNPDVFDVKLLGLLRYGNEPVQTFRMAREQRDSGETIERDGLRLQRFCPHAGEDMAHAIVRDGYVECPRHHWRWDARTGACVRGGTLPLRVEVLDPEAPVLRETAPAGPDQR